jgi:hypothetical protein
MVGLTCPSSNASRKLKKSASGVLASFRSSTYPRGYASGSSLAAALPDSLFEHPAWVVLLISQKCKPSKCCSPEMVFPYPAKPSLAPPIFNSSPAPLTPRQPELSAISYREIGARLEETANNNEKEV